jgi:MarR family transcriptional regulator, lower aerobic nicotinate degradation pathway regulator
MADASEGRLSRLAGQPTWLLSRAHTRAHRLLSDGFGAAGARGYHYRLLSALEEAGPASQAELARRTAIDRSDVVAALDELERAGDVLRAPDQADRRRNVVTITRAGRRRLRELDRTVAEIQRRLLAPLSASERATFVRLLARVAEPPAD